MAGSTLLGIYLARILIHTLVFAGQILLTKKILARTMFFKTRRLQGPAGKRSAPVREQLGYAAVAILIGAAAALMIRWLYRQGWTPIYIDLSDRSGWYFLFSVVAYALLFDLYFYWTHRWLHLRPLYKAVHQVHHRAENTDVYALYYFHPAESAIYALAHVFIVLLLPLHPLAIVLALIWIDLQNWILHWGYELCPAVWRRRLWFFSTAEFHFQHHQGVHGNFGYFTTLWDRLGRTRREAP